MKEIIEKQYEALNDCFIKDRLKKILDHSKRFGHELQLIVEYDNEDGLRIYIESITPPPKIYFKQAFYESEVPIIAKYCKENELYKIAFTNFQIYLKCLEQEARQMLIGE